MAHRNSFAARVAGTPFHPQWLLGRRSLPKGLSGVILDIGAADQWVRESVPDDATYIALDYPATGAALYGSRPHVFADAAHLPFGDDSFDVVVCFEVLEHLADHTSALREAARVMRPGGRLLVTVPFLYPVHDAPYDFQRLTEHGLLRDLHDAGLTVTFLSKTGHAISAATLLLCLAVAGGAYHREGWTRFPLLPLAALIVFGLNLTGWVGSRLWPDWQAIGNGYVAYAEKPGD